MARALIALFLLGTVSGCASSSAGLSGYQPSRLHDQTLMVGVIGSALGRVDVEALRPHLAGKNVRIVIAAAGNTGTGLLSAHVAQLLTKAGAARTDLVRGADVDAVCLMDAFGSERLLDGSAEEVRAFLRGELLLFRPGKGEVARFGLAAKAMDEYASDGSRERRGLRRRNAPSQDEMDDQADEEEEEEEPRDARSRRSRSKRANDRSDGRRSRRKARSSRRRRGDDDDEAEDDEDDERPRRNNRRRRRQPLILD
jgi:hypothetical protein